MPTEADIIIDVADVVFTVGDSGSVDVLISSDASDTLDFYDYRFQISEIGSPVGTLRFTDPQNDDELLDPDYVFFGDSLGSITFVENPPALDAVSGTDLTLSGLGVTLDASGLLLARLDFQHILPGGVDAAFAANDQFQISLVEADTTLLSDSADFLSAITFSGNAGTLSAGVTVVPEPPAITLLALLAILAAISWSRQDSHTSLEENVDF
jgi:hypothetical protein